MADANSLGVKTVEYSDYNKDTLNLSKGKSIGYEYIDEFVNNDKCKFEKVMRSILSTDTSSKNQLISEGIKTDADELLAELAK
jgi:hypothetical protein